MADAETQRRLMDRIADGDVAAFGALYDILAPRVQVLIRMILNGEPGSDDVLQETFWAVWNRADTYDGRRGSVSVWISVLARSRAVDHQRQMGRLRRREAEAGIERHEASGSDDSGSRSDPAVREDERAALERSIEHLSPEQRDVVDLAYARGLTREQISEARGLPIGTIKTRLRRALQLMRHDRQAENGAP